MRVENVKGAVWTVDEVEFYKRRPQRACSTTGYVAPRPTEKKKKKFYSRVFYTLYLVSIYNRSIPLSIYIFIFTTYIIYIYLISFSISFYRYIIIECNFPFETLYPPSKWIYQQPVQTITRNNRPRSHPVLYYFSFTSILLKIIPFFVFFNI